MQTKQQIQQLLAEGGRGVWPNKRLGQHFLIDLNLMRFLVDSAHITRNDVVLEVGCGTGSLTEALAEKACKVIAVESDQALAEIAGTQLAKVKNVQVINTDILETKSAISPTVTKAINVSGQRTADSVHAKRCTLNANRGRVLLVANLPYNVASPVILNLLTGPVTADSMYVTVQKEVARRITATPGEKHYGTSSIFLAATGDVKTIRFLKPTVFWPQPKVNSAMISFVRKKTKASRIKNMELFNRLVNLFMQHRRKMLKTCTKCRSFLVARRSSHGARGTSHDLNWPEIFEQCSIDPARRPDQLSPEDYIAIANLCGERLNQV